MPPARPKIVQAGGGRGGNFTLMTTKRVSWLLALGLVGCASADRIERGAARHQARAAELSNEGRHEEASKERAAAEKQSSKANSRRGFEDAMPIVFH